MGMAPWVNIWIGTNEMVYLEDVEDKDFQEQWDSNGEIEEGGLTFREFDCAEEMVGFGVELFSQHHLEVNEIDLESLYQKAQGLKPKVEQIFKKWGIDKKVAVYILTNYA